MSELPDNWLAITDIETTGLEPLRFVRRARNFLEPRPEVWHEIIEIGLVLVHPDALFYNEKWSVKIKPQRLHLADSRALEINGYNEQDWRDAVSLEKAMKLYAEKTEKAIFAAHNVAFDWSFIDLAFRQTGVRCRMTDYHRFDMYTLACARLDQFDLQPASQDTIARALGLAPEERPHRALNGAMKSFEIYRALLSK